MKSCFLKEDSFFEGFSNFTNHSILDISIQKEGWDEEITQDIVSDHDGVQPLRM